MSCCRQPRRALALQPPSTGSTTPDTPVDDFYERWAERQVGADRAAELAALWREYFAAQRKHRSVS